jgi:hypothetical protein
MARPDLTNELDAPQSCHNTAVIIGRKIDSCRRTVFGDRLLEGGRPPFVFWRIAVCFGRTLAIHIIFKYTVFGRFLS